jgi:hypothetical protein
MGQSIVRSIKLRTLLVAATLMVALALSISAQTTSFTYQGRVTEGGTPANANYDLQFKLFAFCKSRGDDL